MSWLKVTAAVSHAANIFQVEESNGELGWGIRSLPVSNKTRRLRFCWSPGYLFHNAARRSHLQDCRRGNRLKPVRGERVKFHFEINVSGCSADTGGSDRLEKRIMVNSKCECGEW